MQLGLLLLAALLLPVDCGLIGKFNVSSQKAGSELQGQQASERQGLNASSFSPEEQLWINASTSSVKTTGGYLRIYQWNPHWQCFKLDEFSTCKERAKAVLNGGLQSMGVDFANLIELVDPDYQPPAGFGMITATCNPLENALLIYDQSKWKPSSKGGSSVSGCIRPNDRAFNVQMFESVTGSQLSQVVVVGAHYPHSIDVPTLRDSLASVVHSTGVERTIFIGDTNQEQGDSSDIARLLGMKNADAMSSSPLFVSCCHKVHAGFVWKFDRIITNFGQVTDAGYFEVPSWAGTSMHRAVHAKVLL